MKQYPTPRPTDMQVYSIKSLCANYGLPMPDLTTMTKSAAGKWYRLAKEKLFGTPNKRKLVAVIKVYDNGDTEIETKGKK